MSIKKARAGKGNGAGNWLRYKDIDEKRKAMEKLAMKLVKYVDEHPEIYDWSQIKTNWSFSYKRIVGLSGHWECIKEAKEYVNSVFEGRLVHLGMERSKMSDSFIKFMLARRHGWVEKQEVDMKVEGTLSFRDLVSGEEKDVEDETEEYSDEEETE